MDQMERKRVREVDSIIYYGYCGSLLFIYENLKTKVAISLFITKMPLVFSKINNIVSVHVLCEATLTQQGRNT
jgi:hypothetical protein